MVRPEATADRRGVGSELTVKTMARLGLNAAANTGSEWAARVCTVSPVAAFHSRAVVSSLAVASSLPSGLNATEFTAPVWPARVRATSITLMPLAFWVYLAGAASLRVHARYILHAPEANDVIFASLMGTLHHLVTFRMQYHDRAGPGAGLAWTTLRGGVVM